MAFFSNLSAPFLPYGRVDRTAQWAHEVFDIVPVVVEEKIDDYTGNKTILSIKTFDGSPYVIVAPTVLRTSVQPYALTINEPVSFFSSPPVVECWDEFNVHNPSTARLAIAFSGPFSALVSVDPESTYNLPLGQSFGQSFTISSASPSSTITVQLSRQGRA